MIVTTNSELGREIFNFLKSKLEIPDDVKSLTLRMGVGEPVTIECAYYANAKEGKTVG